MKSHVRVKMCGMTRIEDVRYAITLGADDLGFIFYPKSPRNVSIEQAKILLTEVPDFVTTVGVLVNPEPSFVAQLLAELPLQRLQFHGEETPEFCQQFNKPYIKAIHPHNADQIKAACGTYQSADALLLDTPSESRGGTGQSFDWQIIPHDVAKPFYLAGGLDEFNIAEALKASNAHAVDLCSGIEAEPGIKDHHKMSRFMKALRGYDE